MVKATTLLVAAAFIVGPILAAPAPHHYHHEHIAADPAPASSSAVTKRSIDNPDLLDLAAREPSPRFSFKKLFRKIRRVAKKVVPIAAKAARLIFARDGEGNLYVRELDPEELASLEARDPRFNLGRTLRKVGGAVKKGVGVADRVLSTAHRLGLRELDDGVYLEEREFDPSGLYFDLEERDFEDFGELDERDFEEFDELDERDLFRLNRFLRKAKGPASKVLRVADKVSSTAHRLGLRELEDGALEVEARSLDELD